jgi:hypothetical protein
MNPRIKKFYYGDIPEDNAGSSHSDSSPNPPLGGGGSLPNPSKGGALEAT